MIARVMGLLADGDSEQGRRGTAAGICVGDGVRLRRCERTNGDHRSGLSIAPRECSSRCGARRAGHGDQLLGRAGRWTTVALNRHGNVIVFDDDRRRGNHVAALPDHRVCIGARRRRRQCQSSLIRNLNAIQRPVLR